MGTDLRENVRQILDGYDPAEPRETASKLRELWLRFEPKSMGGIKAEQRRQQETVGIPVPALKTIGKEIAKYARKNVDDWLPLARLLWDEYGREGRVVSVYPLGAMELTAPDQMLPLLKLLQVQAIMNLRYPGWKQHHD